MIGRVLRMPTRLNKIFAAFSISLSGFVALAQTGSSPTVVTLGVPPPIVGQQFQVHAVVTNPALSPDPTGSIQFDFGDGTPSVTVATVNRVAITTHTYAALGSAKITASYSGDSTFAPSIAVVSGQILTAVPAVTLNVYGDSISAAGNVVTPTSANWVPLVAYAQGWKLNNSATPGYRVADACPFMYATAINPSSYSATLIGANDIWGSYPVPAQEVTAVQNALLACVAWILIPDTSAAGTHPKFIAQDASVSQTGAWTKSSLNPTMGLGTNGAGDSLSATVAGSTVYVGLSSTLQSNYTVSVLVDGQLAGQYTPANLLSGNYTQTVPYGIRIPVAGSALSASHSVKVVCSNPGTTGCFVDWFGGNGFVAPNQVPLVWLGEPYEDNQPIPHPRALYQTYIAAYLQVGAAFQSDGLGLYLSDVFDNLDGVADPQCLADLIHPALCGSQIIATTYLGAMDVLFTKDQRIDFGQLSPIPYGSTNVPIDVSATSGLPVSLSVTSGPATIQGATITPSAVGVVNLGADQVGSADYLPASHVTASINIVPAAVTVAVIPSATQLSFQSVLSAAVRVSWNGNGPVGGSVTLLDGSSSIGTAVLDSTGAASFANIRLTTGSHELTATYAQQGNFAAGTSPAVEVVMYPQPSLQVTASSQGVSVSGGQQATFSLLLAPSAGFTPTVTFSCSGLPDLASCQFSQSPLAMTTSSGKETVTILTTGSSSSLPPVQATIRPVRVRSGIVVALAAAFWSPGLISGLLAFIRGTQGGSKRRSIKRTIHTLCSLAFIGIVFNGCGGKAPVPRTPVGAYTVVVTATAVQGTTTVTQVANFQLNVTK